MKTKLLVEIVCAACDNRLSLTTMYVLADGVEEAIAGIRGMLINKSLIVICAKIEHEEVFIVDGWEGE